MRLIHTEPLNKVIERKRKEDQEIYTKAQAHAYLVKSAGTATTTHALSGSLYLSKSGWLMLSVPNALVRGAFDALDEPGIELPRHTNGSFTAHISVMRPEEIEQIGGADKISERGHHFHYTLGPIQEVAPKTWEGVSKVWYIKVNSKELQDLRKSYGLSPRPNDSKFDFHITIAVRKKKVLQENEVAKAAFSLTTLSNLAGIHAALKSKEEVPVLPDPELDVLRDDVALQELQQLPVNVVPPRRKKKKVPAEVAALLREPVILKGANHDGMQQMPKESGQDGGTDPGPEGNAGEEEKVQSTLGADDREVLQEEKPTDDFECDPDHYRGICEYYGVSSAADRRDDDNRTADDYVKSSAEEEEERKRRNRNKLLPAGIPLVGGAAAALGLSTPTSSKMPVQVTKFPGQSEPWVIRGRVGHSAPASVIENTGDAYIYAGPNEYDRVHLPANNLPSLVEGVKDKLSPDQRLGLLEIQGHGAFTHQDIGNNEGPLGRINPKTVDSAVEHLNQLPWAQKGDLIGYGCNTGVCAPITGSKPQHDWMKYLSDRTGLNVWGARGYVGTSNDGLNQDVHSTHRGDPSTPRLEAGAFNRPNEDYSFTKYSPGNTPERVETQTGNTQSKETYGWQPNGRLAEILYGLGKPSAIIGTAAAPLISNKRHARNVALGASGLAAPMAIQEILTRFNEAQGRNDMGIGEGLKEHLKTQSNALPYAALASLPLVSYGLANALGRWNKDEKKEKSQET